MISRKAAKDTKNANGYPLCGFLPFQTLREIHSPYLWAAQIINLTNLIYGYS
jgi:hypothetical protein